MKKLFLSVGASVHKTNLDFLLKNKSTRHSRFWTDFWLFPWRPGCPLLCCELQEQICSWLQARFWMRMSPGAERWTPWPPGCCRDVEQAAGGCSAALGSPSTLNARFTSGWSQNQRSSHCSRSLLRGRSPGMKLPGSSLLDLRRAL